MYNSDFHVLVADILKVVGLNSNDLDLAHACQKSARSNDIQGIISVRGILNDSILQFRIKSVLLCISISEG